LVLQKLTPPTTPGIVALFVGNDLPAWHKIQENIKKYYGNKDFHYFIVNDKDSSDPNALFVEICRLKPGLIYLDFCTQFDERVLLSIFLRREPMLSQSVISAFVDDKIQMKQSRQSGAHFIFRKGDDLYDTVFGPMAYAYPDQVMRAQFARGVFKLPDQLFIDEIRIGYMTPQFIHAEGNLRLTPGQKIQIRSKIPRSVLPSTTFIVQKVGTENLYYDYQYWYDLEMVYVDDMGDPPAPKNEAGVILQDEWDKLKKKRKDKYLKDLKSSKAEMLLWVTDLTKRSLSKKTKVLVVDEEHRIFQNHPGAFDQYAFTLRAQGVFTDKMEEIKRLMPNIIVFQFRERDLKNFENKWVIEKELTQILHKLFQKIATLNQYRPLVILFNTKGFDSAFFQSQFGFSTVIAYPHEVRLDLVLKMAKVYENKTPKLELEKSKTPVFYVPKKSAYSFGSLDLKIQLMAMTEAEIDFLCEHDLVQETYRLKFPLEMNATLILIEGKIRQQAQGGFLYRAALSGASELEKKILRQWVNRIIGGEFDEKEEEKEKEGDKKENKEEVKKS
jgi:hypothetical protein